MCGFCLRKWDEIGGSFHVSDTVDKADENVCRFAILVTLMSSRINDERWVQAVYTCLGEQDPNQGPWKILPLVKMLVDQSWLKLQDK
ncbi:hypothetical protein ACLOJK_004008 [Asimina triloba]